MRTLHLWRIFLAITSVILILNMAAIDYFWLQDRTRLDETIQTVNQLTTAISNLPSVATDSTQEAVIIDDGIDNRACGSVCERVIERKVAEALDSTNTTSTSPDPPTTTRPTSPPATTLVSKAGTYYIPFSNSGSTTNRDWTDLSGTETIIDWSEYGSNYTVTWDAYAKVFQGNGKTRIRLFDKTHGIAVPNSELETSSENTVHLVSGELSVWSGTNTYLVQVLSLTGYEAFFESGRIKIVVK